MARSMRRKRSITPATVIGLTSLVLPALTLLNVSHTTGSIIPLAYALAINSVTFLIYGYDKRQSRVLGWRIKEATLHTLAMLGGWPGALLGMHYFQHKTRKTAFLVPFWGIVLLWVAGLWRLWSGGIG